MSRIRSLLMVALSCHAGAVLALDIQLPAETAVYQPSVLPGFDMVQRNCMICHSAQYVLSQPPSSPRPYWDATVKKMRHPFGATFAEDEIAPMVDYLVKTYGAERPVGVATMAKP